MRTVFLSFLVYVFFGGTEKNTRKKVVIEVEKMKCDTQKYCDKNKKMARWYISYF